MGARFESHRQGVMSTSSGLGLTLGSAAAVGFGHVIYCSWPRSPHLYNGNNDGGNNSTRCCCEE